MFSRVAAAGKAPPLLLPPLRPVDIHPLAYSRLPSRLPGSANHLVLSVPSDTAIYTSSAPYTSYRGVAGLANQRSQEDGPALTSGGSSSSSASGLLCNPWTPNQALLKGATTSASAVRKYSTTNDTRRVASIAAAATTTTTTSTTPTTRQASPAPSLQLARDRQLLSLDSLGGSRHHGRNFSSTSNLSLSSSSSAPSDKMYTASFAFFEAIWEAGITHCFVNLGSDHPSIIEAMVKGQREKKDQFPRIITCPNEVSRRNPNVFI